MKPYWQSADGRHTLYHGDCLQIMPALEGPFDAVITDPPYGIGYKSPAGVGRCQRGDYPVLLGDTDPFDPSHLLGFPVVVLWGANHYADSLPRSPAWYVWDKREGMEPNNNSDCELAWCNKGGSARLVRHLWNGMLKATEREQRRCHPTQKPVSVIIWCMEQSRVPDNASVLDPYAGVATTGVACIRTGRRSVQIELSEEYCEIGARRMQAALDAYQPALWTDTETTRPAQLALPA